MVKLYVTYGLGSRLRNNYSVVEGETTQDCFTTVKEVTKNQYAFTYTEEYFAGRADKYNLTEVPLQPQGALL